jgi:histidinol-phosphate/aromatic aminotransferase/cobyric acid decarboxylase-like protein
MLGTLGGVETVVYPSNGNFLAVDCQESGCSANTIADELLKSGFFIRTSDYHSETLKDLFLKISTTVPENWVERFCDEFPRVFEKCAGTITN